MTPEMIANTLFQHHLRECAFEACATAAAPAHMRDWYAERAANHLRKSLAIIGFSLVRTEDVSAATKIVEKVDA